MKRAVIHLPLMHTVRARRPGDPLGIDGHSTRCQCTSCHPTPEQLNLWGTSS